MAYKELSDFNTSKGLEAPFQAVADAVPLFPSMMLFAIFLVLAIGTYFASIRRIGKGDLPASCAVAGFVTVLSAVLMSLIPNFIQPYTVISTIIIEIILVMWLFGSRE